MRSLTGALASVWMAAQAVGCAPEGRPPCGWGCPYDTMENRPFDTAVTCRNPGAPPIDSVEEAVAKLDTDGDGLLTDLDLRPGEARVVLRLEGVHESTGQPSEAGVSLHSDFQADFNIAPYDPQWGIFSVLDCMPEAQTLMWFQFDEGAEYITTGTYPAVALAFSVPAYEVGTAPHRGPQEISGVGHITQISETHASGYFEGRMATPLAAAIPEFRPTGQEVVVEAMAFRDLPIVY